MKKSVLSNWAIDNKTSIYVITIIITLAGLIAYSRIPKEQFPEVVFPQFFIVTVNDGTSPKDMENLVTKHIEKELKSLDGVKEITSTSVQDFSSIIVEFDTDVDVEAAKIEVKDAVDKARPELPTELTDEPQVIEVDVSQFPIMNVNIAGDIDLDKLKDYADDLQDKIEALPEISRADMGGAPEREIQINVDKYRMEAADITMYDVWNAVKSENVSGSAGLVAMDGVKRTLSVSGEFTDPNQLKNLIIRGATGATVYLKDIAEVKDTFEEQDSYARLEGKNVITLAVIKRSGQNLINASDNIRALIKDAQENKYPDNLEITITGDQADSTRVTLHDLINTIIIGFILVTIILMFFMGTTNAVFVALSVPLSMFIAFIVMSGFGFTMNMMVLFSLLLALGIVVDDAIVVIENTHRIYDNGKVPIRIAAKRAAGEVFLPVLSGTLTTLAPFFPLLFWPGVMGEFMFFLPATLIITLMASLVVAYVMNPVFAVDFMKPHHPEDDKKPKINRGFKIVTIVFAIIAFIFYVSGSFGMGNLTVTMYLIYLLNKFVLVRMIKHFQEKIWPAVQSGYENVLTWSLKKSRPVLLLIGTFLLLVFSIVLLGIIKPKVEFFPTADPNFIYAYLSLPVGTDQAYTDSITKIVEKRVTKVVETNNPIVESIISNAGGVGVNDPSEGFDMGMNPHKGKVTVAFVPFGERDGKSTVEYLDKIRESVKGIPGAQITVDQEQGGPPVGKPINIEITGDDYTELILVSEKFERYLDSLQIGGIEDLKSDVSKNKPEITVQIDRIKANAEGISTEQISNAVRFALFGIEASKFKDVDDDYPIVPRLKEEQRNDIQALMNLKITYRDMNMGGQVRQVPLSSVADVKYSSTYGGIKRKDQKRIVSLYSNILTGFTPNEVVAQIQDAVKSFNVPDGVGIALTGEQEDQKETSDFLMLALLVSTGLILIILVAQFNSIGKPLLILTEIIFSVIGVLLGFALFNMTFSILMTGVGIVALAGIVVRNGILLVEFTDELIIRGLPLEQAIVKAGKIRMTPVLLTATATMLGLVPLAVGLNMDFVTLFTELNPHIYFGGDNVAFWGPLSWTIIFGLAFATFLTLILVPCMYLILEKSRERLLGRKRKLEEVHEEEIEYETADII
ncbi:MAG TPA: efflux RND transporter permease subunit [Cytophagales bacterium]|nr:efflux RND transporter permease subunit [Cytophagales bacterium]